MNGASYERRWTRWRGLTSSCFVGLPLVGMPLPDDRRSSQPYIQRLGVKPFRLG